MSPRGKEETIKQQCDVLDTINLMGGRYKLLIVRALLFQDGPMRFGELRRELEGVSPKTLTRNLRDLERDAILTRSVYAEVPPRVEYELTDAGSALRPIFSAMKTWASAHGATLT